MNVAELLERSAFYHADRSALVFGDRHWTYREMDEQASRVAGGLASLGLTVGQRIGLHLPNGPEFALANVSGFKVFPREVEEVLFGHAAVKEAAVIGVPDPVRGEAVMAYVVLEMGATATAEELQALCRSAVAPYKVPERVEFIEALPKNPTGKIVKKDLRARRGEGVRMIQSG